MATMNARGQEAIGRRSIASFPTNVADGETCYGNRVVVDHQRQLQLQGVSERASKEASKGPGQDCFATAEGASKMTTATKVRKIATEEKHWAYEDEYAEGLVREEYVGSGEGLQR